MTSQPQQNAAASIDVEAPISAVTVYRRGARVTRTGRVDVLPGAVELALRGLPASLAADSVRARGRGSAEARLLGVDVRRAFYAQAAQATVQALGRLLLELEEQQRALALRREAAEANRTLLSNLAASAGRQLARAMAQGQARSAEGSAIIVFVREQFETANERLLAVDREERHLQDRIAQVRAELENVSGGADREGYDVIVALEANSAGTVELEVTYSVPNASWTPLYDLRLFEAEDGPRIEATYLAEVSQRSGEAWDDVSLTLSTARPAGGERVPELRPWIIRTELPPMPAPMARREMGDMALPAMAMEESAPLEAEVSSDGPAVTFRVPRRAAVPGDGGPHKATIARLDLMSTLDYVTAPKLDATAYRRARVTNASAYVFLPGRANVFWGDEFVGRAALETVAPGQTFELSLGADDRVTVKCEPVARGADKALLRDVRRSRYGYAITVANLTGAPQTVVVRDQIPVSTSERVTVRLDEADPPPKEKSAMGLLEWELALDAGQEQIITFLFVVEQPRDVTVYGLPD